MLPPIVVLIGPTAVGKSTICHRLIDDGLLAEIISADARQIYRQFDIGTNKPTPDKQKQYSYRLIDICDGTQRYSSHAFVTDATTAIQHISKHGNIPLICGGTGFFILNLLCGLPTTPPPDSTIRAQLHRRVSEGDNLYSELQTIDPATANRLSANDTVRIIRALEVWYSTNRTLSSFQRTLDAVQWNALIIEITMERSRLYQRIEKRAAQMMTDGLAEEVHTLYQRGYTDSAPAMLGIGYRQFFDRNGQLLPIDDQHTMQIEKSIAQATRRYAKRQITFNNHFRHLPNYHAFDVDNYSAIRSCVHNGIKAST